jgi:hypothetical protein
MTYDLENVASVSLVARIFTRVPRRQPAWGVRPAGLLTNIPETTA